MVFSEVIGDGRKNVYFVLVANNRFLRKNKHFTEHLFEYVSIFVLFGKKSTFFLFGKTL